MIRYGLLLVIAALCLGCPFSYAAGRPPPPDNPRGGVCSRPLSERPAICVYFKYSGDQRVGFWMEWTQDGQKMPSNFAGREVSCNYNYARCEALPWFHGSASSPPDFVSANTAEQGFTLANLPYDTDYCFRFKTINEDNLVSDDWTNWWCARTPSPPPPPTMSVVANLSIIAGAPARGASIPETPTRIYITWNKPAPSDHVGWFRVDRWVTRPGATVQWEQIARLFAKDDPGDNFVTEYVETSPANWTPNPQGDAPRYRICAQNYAGKSCSKTLWTIDRFVTAENNRPPDPKAKVVGTASALLATPPLLLEPVPNAHAAMGALRVRIDRSGANGKLYQIDLSHAGNIVHWRVALDRLVEGTVLPAELTSGQSGTWSLTIKVVEPYDGPPSSPVAVELIDPMATTSQSGSPFKPAKAFRPSPNRAIIPPR